MLLSVVVVSSFTCNGSKRFEVGIIKNFENLAGVASCPSSLCLFWFVFSLLLVGPDVDAPLLIGAGVLNSGCVGGGGGGAVCVGGFGGIGGGAGGSSRCDIGWVVFFDGGSLLLGRLGLMGLFA